MNAPPQTLDQQHRQAVGDPYHAPLPAICGALGDRRSWNLPEQPDAAPTAEQLLGWAVHLMAGPWCLSETTVTKARTELERLLTAAQRPAAVELLLHLEGGRTRVFLTVTARSGGGADVAGDPEIAVVSGDVASRR